MKKPLHLTDCGLSYDLMKNNCMMIRSLNIITFEDLFASLFVSLSCFMSIAILICLCTYIVLVFVITFITSIMIGCS